MAAPILLLPREIVDRIVAYTLWPIVEFYIRVLKQVKTLHYEGKITTENISQYVRSISFHIAYFEKYRKIDYFMAVKFIDTKFNSSATEYINKFKKQNYHACILFTVMDHSYLLYDCLVEYGIIPTAVKYELMNALKYRSQRVVDMICRLIISRKIKVELNAEELLLLKGGANFPNF